MNQHIKELARGAAYRWRRDGFKAVRRVPRRLRSELAGLASICRRSTRWKTSALPSSVAKLAIACWEGDATALDLNHQARRTAADWLLLMPNAARICPAGLDAMLALADERADAEIIYADESFTAMCGPEIPPPRLKPEFNPELLLAYDYIGMPVLMRRKSFLQLDGLRSGCGSAVLHDLWLRAWKHGCKFVRLPRVVLHNETTGLLAKQGDTLRVVARFCREELPHYVARLGLTASSVHVARRFDVNPEVTLIIPTQQTACGEMAAPGEDPSVPHVIYLLQSLQRSSWPMDRLRVLIADDRDDGSAYMSQNWPFRLDRLITQRPPDQPFNYARKMNQAWRHSQTDALILMNDDMRVRSRGWIEALMTFALEPEIGGVGGRLLFPDGRLQHAGVVGGPHGTAVHAWFGQSEQRATYQNWALIHRDWSMVTGALFATRRAVLEHVNGFDERFALEFNDLDLCLRLRLLGYRIVYTPFAELIHFEKSSRGPAPTPAEELLRFRRRWKDVIADDPAYHPELACDGYNVGPLLRAACPSCGHRNGIY